MMSASLPLVSIVIPVFNNEEHILRALDSVSGQSYKNFEVVLVNDGSHDNSVDRARDFHDNHKEINLTIIEQTNNGAGSARNTGIRLCKGEFVSFLDADDWWLPGKLEKVVNLFKDEANADLVCHDEIMVDVHGVKNLIDHKKKYVEKNNTFVSMYYGNFLSPSAVTVKKKSLLKTNLFDEKLETAEEYDLWLQLAKFVKIEFINEPLGYFFDNPNGLSQNLEKRIVFESLILKRYASYLGKYCKYPGIKYRQRVSQIVGAVGRDYFERKDYKNAFIKFIRAFIIYPLNYKTIIYPFYLILKNLKNLKNEDTSNTTASNNT